MAGAAHVARWLLPFALACMAAAAAAQPPAALTQQIAGLTALASEPRLAALTAIADALPFAGDGERAEGTAALRGLANKGLFFSPSATEPTRRALEQLRER
jgi:hypothetical protein